MAKVPRIVFSISLAAGLFWLFGFAFESLGEQPIVYFFEAIAALILSALIAFTLFKISPFFLFRIPGLISPVWFYGRWVILTYLMLIPISFGIGYIYVRWHTADFSGMAGESAQFIALFSLWFPLWWATPIGMGFGWLRYKKLSA